MLTVADPVDDPGVFLSPVDGGLHTGLQQSVQHSVLLHGVGVDALEASHRQLRYSVAVVSLGIGHYCTFCRGDWNFNSIFILSHTLMVT